MMNSRTRSHISKKVLGVLAMTVAAVTFAASAPASSFAASDSNGGPTIQNPGGIEETHSPGGVPSGAVGPERGSGASEAINAILYAYTHPGAAVKGVNDFSCKPAKGTRPLVLVPATLSSVYMNWAYYAPKLKAKGLCLYSFNYNPLVLSKANNTQIEGAGFTGDIKSSAAFMAGFVNKVLASTGAKKVDLLGHSQGGGPLPRAYIKYFGGNKKVHSLVGMNPSNKGSTLYGLSTFLKWLEDRHLINGVYTGDDPAVIDTNKLFEDINFQGEWQQAQGSPFLTDLNDEGMTVKGIKYTVIATRNDEVVVPWTNTFLDGASANTTNIVVQNVCPDEKSGHIGAAYDPVYFQLAFNALYPNQASKVECGSGMPF
ncbi:Triacylglycerol lipase [Propionibacterium freudenreichii]|nr:Triacylglycerol lipase [Propionibacterium freudenreichii]